MACLPFTAWTKRPFRCACRAALEAPRRDAGAHGRESWTAAWPTSSRSPLRIGIGIHAGLAIVGTLGPAAKRPIYSAIGDMVNTAARLEDMTKAFACTLVVSEEVLRQGRH